MNHFFRRLSAFLLALLLLTVSANTSDRPDDPETILRSGLYSDVPEGAWYADAAAWAGTNGLLPPTSRSTFSPGETISRICFLKALWRLEGSHVVVDGSRFADVSATLPGSEAVFWATGNGMTTGISAVCFAPDAPLTRQQAVLFLYRCAGLPAPEGTSRIPLFSDLDNVAPWAADAMTYAAETGLMRGLPSARLAPDEPVTRAQAAVLLLRFHNHRNGEITA